MSSPPGSDTIGAQFAHQDEGSDGSDNDADDFGETVLGSSESESTDDEMDRAGSGYVKRSRGDFTEVFTWLTIWIMIVFFVYTSESTYGHSVRRHAGPLMLIFSIPIGFVCFLAMYEAFVISPRAVRAARRGAGVYGDESVGGPEGAQKSSAATKGPKAVSSPLWTNDKGATPGSFLAST